MSNETAGANGGWHTSPAAAKDVPFHGNKRIFPLRLCCPQQLLQFWMRDCQHVLCCCFPTCPGDLPSFQMCFCQQFQNVGLKEIHPLVKLTSVPCSKCCEKSGSLLFFLIFFYENATWFTEHIPSGTNEIWNGTCFLLSKKGKSKNFHKRRAWDPGRKEHIYELVGGMCSRQIKACVRASMFPHYKTKRFYYM